MSVLVINCGSTSIKASVIDPETGRRLSQLRVERLNSGDATATLHSDAAQPSPEDHAESLSQFLPELLQRVPSESPIRCVGHRVVHGGVLFTKPTLLTDAVLEKLNATIDLAPLHNPAAICGIDAARKLIRDVGHVAVFDTAFHATLPPRAATYAIPYELAAKHAVRRFGFHGTSHQFVAGLASEYLETDIRQLRIVSCHLGGGCSVCAIENGRSVETSMGMTPLEGLVMATRSGDIDAGAILHLMRTEKLGVDELDVTLNRKSGLAGLSGVGPDYRDIEQAAEAGDERCRLAIQVFCHRIRKYIGAFAAVMGGVDAILFTAGIGQNSPSVRHHVCQGLDFLGGRLDEQLNRTAEVSREQPVAEFSTRHSRVKLLAVATDESLEIARLTQALCDRPQVTTKLRRIPVAISARHVHLTQETVEALFGEGHELTPLKSLSQPGQFAAHEQVTLVGPKRSIERVRVLGPARSVNQVEVSRTDEFHLGIDAPIRASGDVHNTPGVTLIGSEGRQVDLDHGVICAWRHIHMTPEDAASFGVKDRDVVEVEVGDAGVRSLTFGDVLVRVKDTYKLEMHIDTDEGNAAELERLDSGEVLKVAATVNLKPSNS